MRVFLTTTAIAFTVMSCGLSDSDSDSRSESDLISIPTDTYDNRSSSALRLTDGSFNLASADSFEMELDGCVSGYTATVTTGTLNAYKFDTGCVVQLKSIVLNGKTYNGTNNGADDFTSYTVGSTALFADSTGDTLHIGVSSQIDSPVSGTSPVIYVFSDTEAGVAVNVSNTDVGASQSVEASGEDSPSLVVSSLTYTGMGSNGEPIFLAMFECEANAITSASPNCAGQDVNSMEFALIDDTFGGTMTASDTAAILPAEYDESGDISIDEAIGTNGGVKLTVTGYQQLALNLEQILVVKYSNSYKYYPITIEAVTNN